MVNPVFHAAAIPLNALFKETEEKLEYDGDVKKTEAKQDIN